ncbi:transcriptional activator FtrA [Streptomyces sp. MA5143a]|nr:transcriptional activator FtrA [Streptomyces sp. MA5143a]
MRATGHRIRPGRFETGRYARPPPSSPKQEVGVSPGQWLTRQRVERARHLLESTDLSIDQIAHDAGFGTAQSMRQHLQGALGVTPTAYRRTFRSGGATPAAPQRQP